MDLLALDSLTLNEEAWDSLWCTMMPDIVYAPRSLRTEAWAEAQAAATQAAHVASRASFDVAPTKYGADEVPTHAAARAHAVFRAHAVANATAAAAQDAQDAATAATTATTAHDVAAAYAAVAAAAAETSHGDPRPALPGRHSDHVPYSAEFPSREDWVQYSPLPPSPNTVAGRCRLAP